MSRVVLVVWVLALAGCGAAPPGLEGLPSEAATVTREEARRLLAADVSDACAACCAGYVAVPESDAQVRCLLGCTARGAGAMACRALPRARGRGRGAAAASGSLSAENVRAVIESELHRMTACYSAGLVLDRDLRGRMGVRFVVAPDGSVAEARVSTGEGTSLPAHVTDCVLRAFRRLRFGAPPGGAPVTVNYPLSFSPST